MSHTFLNISIIFTLGALAGILTLLAVEALRERRSENQTQSKHQVQPNAEGIRA